MRRLLLILTLALAQPWTAQAQNATAFDEAMAGLDRVFAEGGDPDRIYQYLTQTVRTSRAVGRAQPDFAIFYAMLADHIRNAELNPVYALRIAEEGLELIAGDPSQSDFATILKVTRSYALADLGRLDEAYAQALLILPDYATLYDADFVEDYRRDAANWGQGQLSEFNTAATDLARDVLERAYQAMEARSFGRVLTLASTALLPMGTGLPEGDVRAINAETEMLMAQALAALGRNMQAGNAWLRALGYMTRTPWNLTDPPDWWGGGLQADSDRAIAFALFEGLAATAGLLGRTDIERAALAQASDYVTSGRDRYSILVQRARLAFADEDSDAGRALLVTARVTAQAAGNDLDLKVADFYLALTDARTAERAGQPMPTNRIRAATEAAVAAYQTHFVPEADFLYLNAAHLLVRSDDLALGLDYARRALESLRARLAARGDTGFGQTQARRSARSSVELFLRASHLAASEGSDDRLAAPGCENPRDFYGCVIVR